MTRNKKKITYMCFRISVLYVNTEKKGDRWKELRDS